MTNFEELFKLVGSKYQKYDENGKALGCLAPMYSAFPDEKGYRFDWPEGVDLREYMLSELDKHCDRIPLDDIQPGDFLTMKMPRGLYHVSLYLGDGKMLHCLECGTEISRTILYKNRIERGYRWNGRSRNEFLL
jgi:hypothetical protein